jgi:hypothetical protein
MSSRDRRSAGRRRAWGRGPIILKFEPLEKREVFSTAPLGLPDLVASSFVTTHNADWNGTITAIGQITNQGRGPVLAPFNVGIYASHNASTGNAAVMIGEVAIPAGIAPGQSVPFTTTVKLPASPLPGMSANGVVHINLKVDPEHMVPEITRRNNSGLGVGLDQALVQITPAQPAQLVSTSIGINPTNAQWGGSIAVTAQISNSAYGDAPATRAQVVLTPAGVAPGGSSDVTIGSIMVPPVPAWSSVNIEQNIPLPVTPPQLLAGDSQFTLSLMPDADYLTNIVYPHLAPGGLGVDQASVNITVPPGTTPPPLGPLSDLAPGAVTPTPTNLIWGHSFQASTVVQNLGSSDPGPFRVRFLLVGASGDASHALFLGDAVVQDLPPGNSTVLDPTLTLPLRLPASVTLSSLGTGRIAVVVDPENLVNETFKNNNIATSGPVNLRLLGTDGTSFVPNLPPPGQLLAVNAAATTTTLVAPAPGQTRATKRLFRKPPPAKNTLLHSLSVFPKQVNDFLKKYI